MHAPAREAVMRHSLADHLPQPFGIREILHQHGRPTHLGKGVGIGAGGAGQVVLPGEQLGFLVPARPDTAGVEGLQRVDVGQDFEQCRQLPAAPAVHGMGDADKSALRAQALDGSEGSQPARHGLFHEEG